MLTPPPILSSDPLATLAAAARRRAATYAMPTVAELVALAVHDTDFLGDLTPDTAALAADCADQAAEQWEEARAAERAAAAAEQGEDARDELPGTVAPELVLAARGVLRGLADALVSFGEVDAANALSDAIESGDVDADGNAVAYG
jgi:hypothetical protein